MLAEETRLWDGIEVDLDLGADALVVLSLLRLSTALTLAFVAAFDDALAFGALEVGAGEGGCCLELFLGGAAAAGAAGFGATWEDGGEGEGATGVAFAPFFFFLLDAEGAAAGEGAAGVGGGKTAGAEGRTTETTAGEGASDDRGLPLISAAAKLRTRSFASPSSSSSSEDTSSAALTLLFASFRLSFLRFVLPLADFALPSVADDDCGSKKLNENPPPAEGAAEGVGSEEAGAGEGGGGGATLAMMTSIASPLVGSRIALDSWAIKVRFFLNIEESVGRGGADMMVGDLGTVAKGVG